MNIHFDSKKLRFWLEKSTLLKVPMGSTIYGLDNENSDRDILHIYAEGRENEKSFLWEHHTLQFKTPGADLIFCPLQLYIRNILTGDSTAYFETLFTKEFEESSLQFLKKFRDHFVTYNVLRAYLGFAKRDFSRIKEVKIWSDKSLKTAVHFLRGIETVQRLLSKTYHNDFSHLLPIKNGITIGKLEDMLLDYTDLMFKFRAELNESLNEGSISKYPSPEILEELDLEMRFFMSSREYLGVQRKELNYGSLFYDALANGVSYDGQKL